MSTISASRRRGNPLRRHNPLAPPSQGGRVIEENCTRGQSLLPLEIRKRVVHACRSMKMSRDTFETFASLYIASPRRLREWASSPLTIGRAASEKLFVFQFDRAILEALDHNERCGDDTAALVSRCPNPHHAAATTDRWKKMFGIEEYGRDMWIGDVFAVDALARHSSRVELSIHCPRDDDEPRPFVRPLPEVEETAERNGGLLCIGREVNQQVYILLPDGRHGRVMVTTVRGNKVRLGFDFPRDIKVMRSELLRPTISTAPGMV